MGSITERDRQGQRTELAQQGVTPVACNVICLEVPHFKLLYMT